MGHLTRLFDHMYWADERVLRLIDVLDAPDLERIVGLFAHIIAAEGVWLARLQERDSSALEIWPQWSAADVAEAAIATRSGYVRLLEQVTGEGLKRVVEYRNSQGKRFQTRLDDILLHVATHGAYHRGQIALAVRAGGGSPVNTDFITYVRETA